MINNKIRFHSKSFNNMLAKEFEPKPSKGFIPKWFYSKNRYIRDADGNKAVENYVTKDGSNESINQRTFKTCPAIFDSFSSGYILSTPCDIEIKRDGGSYSILLDNNFKSDVNTKNGSICFIRGEESGFPTPAGHSPVHFAWTTNWFPELPEDYTALFIHPINRFDLPFTTVSGSIDCSGYIMGGAIPVCIQENFEGVIKAGTPFIQIIPFKNEAWSHENIYYDEQGTTDHRKEMNLKYMVIDKDHDTNYKAKFWRKKIW
jgi:hypothetical protein